MRHDPISLLIYIVVLFVVIFLLFKLVGLAA